MNEDLSSEMLQEVAGRVLEETAFVFTEPMEPVEPWTEEVIEGELTFEGPRNGRLFLASTPDFCINLAANLLGVEPDDPDATDKSFGALGEMLNILAGVMMERLFGGQIVCHLGLPQVKKSPKPIFEEEPMQDLCSISLMDEEEHRIDVAAVYEGTE